MKLPAWINPRRGPLAFGITLTVFAIAILAPSLHLAGELEDVAAAQRLVSEQRRQPDVLLGSLVSARDRLEAFGYVEEPLSELRRATIEIDQMVGHLSEDPEQMGALAISPSRPLQAEALGAKLHAVEHAWEQYRAALQPVIEFKGVPYVDSESRGTQLNAAGRQLSHDLGAGLLGARSHNHALVEAIGKLSTALDAETARLLSVLRYLMLAALAVSIAFGVALIYFVFARRRESQRVASAEQQTRDILRTVKEGLLLLDAEHRIGDIHSASLEKLFKRDQIAGLSFGELLKPLVPEKTLQTATKFVEVLWQERTRENLVRSINPLHEVEVSFDNGNGGHETRYLDFDFHRVKSEGRLTSILVSVSDVTQRVQLSRELAEAREKAQNQLDTLLGILHLNPQQLQSFLDDSDVSVKMINAILREPAREESAFRRKLDSIFRQVHAMKGEAAALGLGTVQSRAHDFEDALRTLKEKRELSGGDFLPLVVKLDELFTHLAAVRDLVTRLAPLQAAQQTAVVAEAEAQQLLEAEPEPEQESPIDVIGPTLVQLVERLAQGRGKEASAEVHGLERVPNEYRRPVKDIAVQIVRNALVHGIEEPAVRAELGKAPAGRVSVDFKIEQDGGFRLVVEDDGAGLSARKIRETAVERGLLTADDARQLDQRQLLALLFRPGFSTMAEADEDGGRGVGMNVVADLVKSLKGRIAVASSEGRYTRFTIALPARGAARNAA
jgi:HPt (histidine-containing phosphotransfer) domain-containing protein/PAS domain-containing protein